jgi:hypothetical protein
MELDDREQKLLVLALDPAAADGERLNATSALLRSWRGKYADGYEVIQQLQSAQSEIRERIVYRDSSPYASTILQFGKHRGKRLDEVDPLYLHWLLDNFDDLWPSTRLAIERYLEIKS